VERFSLDSLIARVSDLQVKLTPVYPKLTQLIKNAPKRWYKNNCAQLFASKLSCRGWIGELSTDLPKWFYGLGTQDLAGTTNSYFRRAIWRKESDADASAKLDG
jgi:hypothetical protein